VKLRKRYLPVAAVLGAAVAIVPALATGSPAPSEVKLEVAQNCYLPNWPCWNPKGNPESNVAVSEVAPFKIAEGGTISFEDNDSKALTDVVWKGAAPTCTGVVEAPPTKTDWSGTCTFAAAGEYEFESTGLFNDGSTNYTKYRVIVEKTGGGTTTGTTSTTTTTTTTTTSPPPPPPPPTTTTSPPPPSPPTTTTTAPTTTMSTPTTPTATASTQPSGGTPTATTPGSIETPAPSGGGSDSPVATLALASAQHGDAVHGTVQVPAADGGARLEVELLAQGASLAKVKRGGGSRVGRFVRSSAPAGTVSFAVSLDAQAKRALRHRHKLALTVKIVLTPEHGAAVTLTRSVVVR
jgi:hypothetical protein